MLIQQESNSFAIRPSSLGDFKIRIGKEAEEELRDTNSEFNGALREIGDRGGIAVPVIYMHALPGGVLRDDDFDQLIKTALTALNEVGHLDGLILSLHGAMATVSEPAADAILCRTFAERAKIPLALSLDLHANCTPRLVAPAKVVTGYKTNPHVDLASTGARAVAMLCATMNGTLTPRMAMATRPAIFPDEALRIETGVLGEILDHCLADVGSEIVDVSVFPTQPWLDAPGVGFTTLVTTDDDMSAAQHLADRVADEVWRRRDEFTVERLASPSECLRTALDSSLRPSIITESADAPLQEDLVTVLRYSTHSTKFRSDLARWSSQQSSMQQLLTCVTTSVWARKSKLRLAQLSTIGFMNRSYSEGRFSTLVKATID